MKLENEDLIKWINSRRDEKKIHFQTPIKMNRLITRVNNIKMYRTQLFTVANEKDAQRH